MFKRSAHRNCQRIQLRSRECCRCEHRPFDGEGTRIPITIRTDLSHIAHDAARLRRNLGVTLTSTNCFHALGLLHRNMQQDLVTRRLSQTHYPFVYSTNSGR